MIASYQAWFGTRPGFVARLRRLWAASILAAQTMTPLRKFSLHIPFRQWTRPGRSRRCVDQVDLPTAISAELLEDRILLASAEVEWRKVDFEINGRFTGQNTGTYQPFRGTHPNCLPSDPPPRAPYADSFEGLATGIGSLQYTSNTSGTGGEMTLDANGSGTDTFWESYDYRLEAQMNVSDNGGMYTLNATGGGKPEHSNIVDRFLCGGFIEPQGQGQLPRIISGAWSPQASAISWTGANGFQFNGTIQLITPGPTDIAVNHVKAGNESVEFTVDVTGALPQFPHVMQIGTVDAEWLNRSGAVISKLVDGVPVYWNTGKISLKEDASAIPENAVQLRVSASMLGDSNGANNEMIVNYAPDWSVTSIAWVPENGVRVSYAVAGKEAISPATLGLYWENGRLAAQASNLITSEGSETIHFTASQIASPLSGESKLVARIDTLDEFLECNEDNNQQEITLVPAVFADVIVQPAETERGTAYNVTYAVTNQSPVSIDIDVRRGWTTDNPQLSPPAPVEVQLSNLKPGESNQWTEEVVEPRDWAWVPETSPVEQSGIESLLIGLAQDFAEQIAKSGGNIWVILGEAVLDLINDTLQAVKDLREIYDIQSFPEANITHAIIATPVVSGGSSSDAAVAVRVHVGDDKLKRLNAYKAHELKIYAAVLALGNLGVPETVQKAIRYAVQQVSLAAGIWENVKDPPDPDFRTFAVPQFNQDGRFDELAAGPLRESARNSELLEGAMEAALIAAINKRDGAATGSDHEWRLQQLVHAAWLSHNAFFARVENANFLRFLAPRNVAARGSSADRVAFWQNNALPPELTAGLRELGWDDEQLDGLLGFLRSRTAADFDLITPDVEVEIARVDALHTAAQTLELLRRAVRDRVTTLGMPSRELDDQERRHLDASRADITARLAVEDFNGTFRATTQAYAVESLRLALLTNNYAAVEADLNLAYAATVGAAGTAGGLTGFESTLDAATLPTELRVQLASLADSVEQGIAGGLWSELDSRITALGTAIRSAPDSEIDPVTRSRLLNLADELGRINSVTPGIEVPTVGNVPNDVVIPAGMPTPVLGDAIVVEPGQVATYVGGTFTMRVQNPETGTAWIVEEPDRPDTPLNAGTEVRVDGVSIAKVTVAEPAQLEVVFLADATPARTQEFLRRLQVKTPIDSPVGMSTVDATLDTGLGGATHVSIDWTLEPGEPPAVLDADGNGLAAALSDGILILRYTAGFHGAALTDGVVDVSGGVRTEPDQLVTFLEGARDWFDVDGNGEIQPLSDGILVIRYLAQFTETALTQAAVDAANGTRTSAPAIRSWLDDLMPPAQAPAGNPVQSDRNFRVSNASVRTRIRMEPDGEIGPTVNHDDGADWLRPAATRRNDREATRVERLTDLVFHDLLKIDNGLGLFGMD